MIDTIDHENFTAYLEPSETGKRVEAAGQQSRPEAVLNSSCELSVAGGWCGQAAKAGLFVWPAGLAVARR